MGIGYTKRHIVNEDEFFLGALNNYSPDIVELLLTYNDLSDVGKAEAIKRIQELAELSQYQRETK